MKNIAWKSLLGGAFLSCLAVAPASAQLNFGRMDTSLYLGGSVGGSHFRHGCSGVPVSCDNDDVAWKALVGYQFTPHFAIEGGYTDLGKVTANGTLTGVAVNAEGKSRGWEVVAIGLYPIPAYSQLAVFGKVGAFRSKTDVRLTGAVPGFSATVSASDHHTDLTYGGGVKYTLTPNMAARLEWQRYHDVGGDNTGKQNIDVYSLGLLYNF